MRLIVIILSIVFFGCKREGSIAENGNVNFEIQYYPDSTVKEVVQKQNGLLSGKGLSFNSDGTKKWEYNYVNDQQEGIQYYYNHGELNFAVPFKNGNQHGWATRYGGPCGSISEEGQYEEGKMNGLWYDYYDNELLEVSLYRSDSQIKIIYRSKKYPDRNIPLPPIVRDCDEQWNSGEELK